VWRVEETLFGGYNHLKRKDLLVFQCREKIFRRSLQAANMKKYYLLMIFGMVILIMVCTVPYKKHEGHEFVTIVDDGHFELMLIATYDSPSLLLELSGNPYKLGLFFKTDRAFIDGQILIDQLKISSVSTGDVVYSDGGITLDLKDYEGSEPYTSYWICDLNLPYDSTHFNLTYKTISNDQPTNTRTVDGILRYDFTEKWFNPVWRKLEARNIKRAL